MFTTLTIKELPWYYEAGFNKEKMIISFSLCSEANDYFLSMLPKSDIWADSYKKCKFAPFVFNENSWGFGGVFKKNNEVMLRDGWITWECQLPKKATHRALDEISSNIQFITSVMELFICEHEKAGIKTERQFMTIDGVIVRSDGPFEHGGLGFSFSLPVLEFCRKIWNDEKIYNGIIENMEAVWNHLLGQKELKSCEHSSFDINHYQDDPRLISLHCPGNAAWVNVGYSLLENHKGAYFSSHNVDIKFQQFTLLAGAITIANLARESIQKKG